MNKLKQSVNEFNMGWAINVYDGDRRLLCTFNPSHAWAFGIGLVLGGLLAISWSNGDRPRLQPNPTAAPKNAPLVVD